MFSSSNDKDAAAQQGQRPAPVNAPASAAPAARSSFIGSDMKIFGDGLKVIAEHPIQVDGEVEGDVLGTRVTIGHTGYVKGLINAEAVQINGKVEGMIRGVHVSLTPTANVTGDIYHQVLTLEMGASFDGSSHKAKDRSEVLPDLSGAINRGQYEGMAPNPTASDILAVSTTPAGKMALQSNE